MEYILQNGNITPFVRSELVPVLYQKLLQYFSFSINNLVAPSTITVSGKAFC